MSAFEIQMLNQKIEAIRGEMNQVLTDMATTLERIIKMNKMFQIYVDENIRELREHCKLTGALITDTVVDESGNVPRTGKEL